MKTYKTIIEKPRLEIRYEEDAESPREWSNLGYFITVDSRMESPDQNGGVIYNIVKETGENAGSQEEHIEMIKTMIEDIEEEKVLAIYPVTKYEHSGVVYKIGNYKGFDYSQNGFYIITDKTQKEVGTEKDFWKKQIDTELSQYNQWISGEVFRFTLYDKDGEIEDSCGGFWDIEDIREYLPEDWKDEKLEDYLNN